MAEQNSNYKHLLLSCLELPSFPKKPQAPSQDGVTCASTAGLTLDSHVWGTCFSPIMSKNLRKKTGIFPPLQL